MMKYLAGICILFLLVSCHSKKQATNSELSSNEASIKLIEVTRQKTYPGQKNDGLKYIEHWVIIVEGRDVTNKEMYLQIGNYEIDLRDKVKPKLIIGSDSQIQTIEFDIKYPLVEGEVILGGDNGPNNYLAFVFEDEREKLLLENIIELEPVILPSSQD